MCHKFISFVSHFQFHDLLVFQLMMEKLDTVWGLSPRVYTISRGPLCNRFQEQWAELRKCAEDKELQDFRKFVINLKDCDDFSGVLHRNGFKVSHDIGLVGLGFFGPHVAEIAAYNVVVTIEEMRRNVTLQKFKFFDIPATKREMFYVNFQNVVTLKSNKLYNIGFELNGPKTGILDGDKIKGDAIQFLDDDEGTRIEFNFLRGSMQMPEMRFVIL